MSSRWRPDSRRLAVSLYILSINRSFASNKTGSAIVPGPREALAAQAKNVYIRRN